MSYSSYLSDSIKSSGLSLRSIATLCEKNYNIKISAAYLSKLQKEGNNPASEKVNIAIAKVLGINPDDLLFEADFERAPESVKQTIDQLVSYLKSFFISTNDTTISNDANVQLALESELNKYLHMSNREFLNLLADNKNFDYSNPFELQPDEFEDTLLKFSINIPMKDNSMFPLIRQGAKLEIVKLEEYTNGDIISVDLPDGKNLIRTYVESGDNIVLVPANSEFETLTIPKKNIFIKGKIKSYTVDL
ncbi:MAG: S24 family peptidase [Clostridia bacterium]